MKESATDALSCIIYESQFIANFSGFCSEIPYIKSDVIAQYCMESKVAFWAIKADNFIISLFPERISLIYSK